MSPGSGTSSKTITAILLEAGVVTHQQIDSGLERQRETGRRIGETLVEMGCVSEEDIGWALARQLGLPFVDVSPDQLDPDLVHSFPEGALRRLRAVPLVRSEGRITAAVADPTDGDALRELEVLFDAPTDYVAATPTAIVRALDVVLGHRAGHRARPAEPAQGTRHPVLWERSGESFLNFHLLHGRRLGAAEVHFVLSEGGLQVFHRVGARLIPVIREPESVADVLLRRLEALGVTVEQGRNDHAWSSVRCELGGSEQTIDLSLLAARDSVSVTVRLPRGPAARPRLDALGCDPLDVAELRESLRAPSGLVLVSGPAGCGRSTTLGALLEELGTDNRRWLVCARDPRRWPAPSGLVDIVTGDAARRWRGIASAHGVDGLVLDGGLEGPRVRLALASATHGRWVLAATDWEDTFALLEWMLRSPGGRVGLARRLRAVIQQRLVATPGGGSTEAPGEPLREPSPTPPDAGSGAASVRAVFEVLVPNEALRAEMLRGASPRELASVALGGGFRPLEDRVRAAVARGDLDADDAQRAVA